MLFSFEDKEHSPSKRDKGCEGDLAVTCHPTDRQGIPPPSLLHRIPPKAAHSGEEQNLPQMGRTILLSRAYAQTPSKPRPPPQTPHQHRNPVSHALCCRSPWIVPRTHPPLCFPKGTPISIQVASPTSCSPWVLGGVAPKLGGPCLV